MKYNITSGWAGKYAKTKYGFTESIFEAVLWWISWTISDTIRALRLNKYHYGNIFAIGEKQTDIYGRKKQIL